MTVLVDSIRSSRFEQRKQLLLWLRLVLILVFLAVPMPAIAAVYRIHAASFIYEKDEGDPYRTFTVKFKYRLIGYPSEQFKYMVFELHRVMENQKELHPRLFVIPLKYEYDQVDALAKIQLPEPNTLYNLSYYVVPFIRSWPLSVSRDTGGYISGDEERDIRTFYVANYAGTENIAEIRSSVATLGGNDLPLAWKPAPAGRQTRGRGERAREAAVPAPPPPPPVPSWPPPAPPPPPPASTSHTVSAPPPAEPAPAPPQSNVKEEGKPPPNLFWNTWAEDDEGPRLYPVPCLKTDTLYRLSLDLAAIRYRVAGVVAAETGQVIKKQVEKWLKTAMPPQTLSVLLLPDPGMFVIPPTPPAVANFVVNVDRLRAIRDSGIESTDNASFQIQRDSSKVGETVFKVRTKGHQGPAAVAFSIWYQDRPIDEISVRFCIADTPETEKAKCGIMNTPVAPQGLALIRVADDSAPSPKAAIHYVSFGEDLPVTGVFHDISWEKDQFIVWQHNQTAKNFSKFISKNFMKNIASGATDNNLLVRGEDLFLFLFPKDVTSIDGTKTKIHKHVRDFLLPYLQAKPPPVDNVPSLFVRMIRVAPSPSLPIPLGLIAVRLDEAKGIITKDNGRFLGDYFLIESPLEVQTYASFDNCLSRWVMVLPPGNTGDDAITQALAQLGDTIENWRDKKEALPFDRMTSFANWINRTLVSDGEDLPTTLITLSHHNENSLYFYENDFEYDNPLQISKINRKFAQPSVAILDGCGTGGEGALELIRALNYRGFSTIVAAPAEIKGYMAGSFLKVFADEIAASDPAKGETIGKVYWKSIQQLKKAKPEGISLAVDYGAKAHLFSLLGNGEVPICAPRKENRPNDELNGGSR